MPEFSAKSAAALASCHPELQRLFNEVVKTHDCAIIEGHRCQAAQDKAFREGKSKLKYPHGKHNAMPSNAVDVAPYPVDWNNKERFIQFASFVIQKAGEMGVGIRWGGAWSGKRNGPGVLDDTDHFELLEKKL